MKTFIMLTAKLCFSMILNCLLLA